MTHDNLVERQNEWKEENFPSADQILTDDEGELFVFSMDENGKLQKNYLPTELQWSTPI